MRGTALFSEVVREGHPKSVTGIKDQTETRE